MLAIVWIHHHADPDAIASHVDSHRAYLADLERREKLVASGPFTPRTGGALILDVRDEAEARQLLAEDPYAVAGVATHELRSWTPNRGELANRRPLADKVAIVTGASSGIGEAVAMALSRCGASIALAARRRDRLDALATRIGDAGQLAKTFPLDLAEDGQAHALVDRVVEQLGRIDIVVNSAGIMLLSPVAEATGSDWRRMIELNLISLMEISRAALPHLRRTKGQIVNIASLAGRIANPNASGYAASKFGVVGFSESLRREVFSDGIRVTVIEPGVVATELGDHIENSAMKDGLRTRMAQMEPLHADDIAHAVVYSVTQPPHVSVNEIVVRPTGQER